MRMVRAGNAQCVLGNHELNIARNAKKLDNGWYFDEIRDLPDNQRAASVEQRKMIREFLSGLPLTLSETIFE